MREEKLYLQSDALQKRIQEIAAATELASKGRIRYEEMIALPYFGQIMLRFDLADPSVTLDQLEWDEVRLRAIAGEDFLVDFMGDVYASAGVDLSKLEEKLPELAKRYEKERCRDSVHAPFLRADGRALLQEAGMDPDLPLWEIQIDGDEILLLTMDKEPKPAIEIPGRPGLFAGSVSELASKGLFRAALFAARNRVSLARVLSQ